MLSHPIGPGIFIFFSENTSRMDSSVAGHDKVQAIKNAQFDPYKSNKTSKKIEDNDEELLELIFGLVYSDII